MLPYCITRVRRRSRNCHLLPDARRRRSSLEPICFQILTKKRGPRHVCRHGGCHEDSPPRAAAGPRPLGPGAALGRGATFTLPRLDSLRQTWPHSLVFMHVRELVELAAFVAVQGPALVLEAEKLPA